MSVEPVPRVSDRGAATRSALLSAAREVFSESGFAQAAVTDIVTRAGASVGSLYHHFSGKADLYLTLFEEFQGRQQERTRDAIRPVRDRGETEPMRLFVAGARAYLDGCLTEPDLARLFASGDGPPGFDRVLRDRLRTWARRNAALFETGDRVDEALVVVLTGAVSGAVSEVSLSDDAEASRRLADDVLTIISAIERRP